MHNIRKAQFTLIFRDENKSGQDFIWKYFKDYTKLLLEKFGGANSSLFQHCFRTSADCQCSNTMMKEVEVANRLLLKIATSFPRVWEQMKHERFIVPYANHRINILERADVKDEISSVMFQNKTEQSQGSLKGPEPSLNSHRK
ncbi:Puromycin-sensitive aminopeptidase [Dirofilaria immitis]|nr:Puromycin-sensitive aminopeptidase [Dirofilaria immitis]